MILKASAASGASSEASRVSPSSLFGLRPLIGGTSIGDGR